MRECHRSSSSLCLSMGIILRAPSLSTKASKRTAKHSVRLRRPIKPSWRVDGVTDGPPKSDLSQQVAPSVCALRMETQ